MLLYSSYAQDFLAVISLTLLSITNVWLLHAAVTLNEDQHWK